MAETSEAAPESGPGVHASERPESTSRIGTKEQPETGAPLHLLNPCRCRNKWGECACRPSVEVTNRGTSTLVRLVNPPWRWVCCDQEFLHRPPRTSSRAAEGYAAELRERLATAAWMEHHRQERIKELRRREIEARTGTKR